MKEVNPWSRITAELYALFSRNPKSSRLVVELAELARDHVTLDVGCGPGAAVRMAAPLVRRAVGVDNSAAMVHIAARRSGDVTNVEYQVGSAEALPFAAASFDRVWTVHAFHHWSDQSVGITEALRVLRPGGRFLVVEQQSGRSHSLTTAEAEALTERLIGAGFSDARVSRQRKELVITADT